MTGADDEQREQNVQPFFSSSYCGRDRSETTERGEDPSVLIIWNAIEFTPTVRSEKYEDLLLRPRCLILAYSESRHEASYETFRSTPLLDFNR